MKAPKTKLERVVSFFQNLFGIKPSNGIKRLKKKYGVDRLVGKETDCMLFSTSDGGLVIVKSKDAKGDYFDKTTNLVIKKVGGETGLSGAEYEELNTVAQLSSSKKYGISELISTYKGPYTADYMIFSTKDGGFIAVERKDTTGSYFVKGTDLFVRKIGGETGLNGLKHGEFNTVERYSRSRVITDRPYTDYSVEPKREVQAPHIEVNDAAFHKGHLTFARMDHIPLPKSAYARHGFPTGNMKV